MQGNSTRSGIGNDSNNSNNGTGETFGAGRRGVLDHHRLVVFSRDRALVALVHSRAIGHAELRGQSQRAAVSVGLNFAEGAALVGAAKQRHYKIARGSVVEVVAAYELAADIGECLPVEEVTRLGAEISAMLSALTR